ncbi:small secreted protein [Streptomyces sp. NPDC054884]|uniref:small secreted protein n=1 Tax=Streptomyces sp. ME08-AFT2 TaxID=3028683 RepID=UPI0029BB879A|nr:small secreted protein [Streptomyces sp. ME08-AFT2]MDX3314577.1 small secreted protein [Streptomyces sp. ME08-AFT2]
MEGTKPVNKKLTAALSGGAVLVLALSGCSSDEGNKELDAWAEQVCDALPAQDAKVDAANAAIKQAATDNNAPVNVQKTDSKAFQDMSDAYSALAQAVQKAGTPPGVDNGEKKQKDAVAALTTLSTSYAGLKKQVDALDTKDQGKFADGLQDIATDLGKLSKSGNTALKNLEQGDVKDAMAKQDSCKKVAASASARATKN